MNAEETAKKNDSGKVMVELVTPRFIWWVGKVLTHGAEKYGQNNWRKGLAWMRIYGSVIRHMTAWAAGEDNDPESKLSHLAHAATNIMFLMEWGATHKELDDRIKL